MGKLIIECDTLKVSDGEFTFESLYEHRNFLFILLMKHYPEDSWYSFYDDEGNKRDDVVVSGITLPSGIVSYPIPIKHLEYIVKVAKHVDRPPIRDFRTQEDRLNRIKSSINNVKKIEIPISVNNALDENKLTSNDNSLVEKEDTVKEKTKRSKT